MNIIYILGWIIVTVGWNIIVYDVGLSDTVRWGGIAIIVGFVWIAELTPHNHKGER